MSSKKQQAGFLIGFFLALAALGAYFLSQDRASHQAKLVPKDAPAPKHPWLHGKK